MIKYLLIFICTTLSILVTTSIPAFANPYGYGDRDRDSGYEDSRYDDRDRRDDLDRERRDLERERDRLDDERRRLEDERQPAPSRELAPAVREQCPSGFSPSENKCSVEERRRGCKDMRLPGGLGCVHR